MPERLVVDPVHLELAGATLQAQVLPQPPPPIAAAGADAVSGAINVTMPVIEAPIVEGLPAAQAGITATGSKIAAAARMYAETDQSLGEKLGHAQFTGTGDKAAPPSLHSAYSVPQGPAPNGGPQASPVPPPVHEQSAQSAALAAGGPSAPDSSVVGGGPDSSVVGGGPAAVPNPEASEDALGPSAWAAPAESEAPDGLADSDASGLADSQATDGAVKPASFDGSGDSEDASTDQQASGDPQDPSGQETSAGQGTADGPETPGSAQETGGEEPGMQNGTGTPDGSKTAEGAKTPGDPKAATGPAAQQNRAASGPPRGAGLGGRGLFSASQAGGGSGGRGIPQSLTGSPKPAAAPYRPAAAHGHSAPVSASSTPGQPLRPMPGVPAGAHAAPLSPATPAAPLSSMPPAAPHSPLAPATPPVVGGGETGPGPAAPAAPGTPLQPATPGTSPVAADPGAETGAKPAAAVSTPPAPRGRDAVMASIPVSPALAERDAVASAASSDASRRDGVDPLLLARRIAAALNAPGADQDSEDGEENFGFFWVTAVTTGGAIAVANSYGIAYLPDGVRLPDPVYFASADDEIPAADRASWATYPVIAVQGWAAHHEFTLRAVIATEEQLADSAPGVEKMVLQPDDIPDSGEMIGRTRLEVVDPRAAEWLAAVPDESLLDRLPPPVVDAGPPAEDEGMLWFEVMEPMFSLDTGREDAHLRAFSAYAAHAQYAALKQARRRVDAETRRSAMADWLYWKHLTELHDTALSDPSYRRRWADLYDGSAAGD